MMLRVAGLFALLAFGTCAYATPNEADRAEYLRAGARFAVLIAEAEAESDIGRLKTDEFRQLVDTLSDEERMIGKEPIAFQDMPVEMEICDVANKSLASILAFGMKNKINFEDEESLRLSREDNAKVEANLLTLQHETKDLLAFLLRCLVRPISAVTTATAGFAPEDFNEEARGGLALMRSGVEDVVTGACEAATDTRFDEDLRGTLLAVVAETSEVYASVMKLESRRRIAAQIEASQSKSPENFKVHVDAILAAFRNDQCTGLCRID